MADYPYIAGPPGSPSEDERYVSTMQEFSQLQLMRYGFAAQWEEIAQIIWPARRNTFFYGNSNWPGMKKTERQVDATGMVALGRFAAICDSLLTPRNMTWHTLTTTNRDINRDRSVRLWFEQATRLLFDQRYAPHANFEGQNHVNFHSLGAFGTHAMFIDTYHSPVGNQRGLRYKSLPMGEVYLKENHQGLVDGFIRWFRLTAQQCYTMFGPERFPETLRPALEKQSLQYYNFLHHVCLRSDYDPDRLDYRGKPWESCYWSIEGRALLQEGGYNSFPLAVGRYVQEPGEIYGRSPAMMVLPALKTLNLEKSTYLKVGHRIADPIILTSDTGIIDDFDMAAGSINAGGLDEEGRELVKPFPTGSFTVAKEMLDEERQLINDVFLVSVFRVLEEDQRQITATEMIERINEKGILMAPTVGRQASEYLGPMIDRELDLMSQLRLLPPMPGLLREARGEYSVTYTSPLAKAARAQEAAGFMRVLETGLAVVNATQDGSALDGLAIDRSMQGIAEIQAVPASWMATPAEMAAKAKGRAQAQQREQTAKELPARAAMMKAQMQARGGAVPPAGVAAPIPFPGPQ